MAELATERMVVTATPEQCFAVVSDIERYPEWAGDIKDVSRELEKAGYADIEYREGDEQIAEMIRANNYEFDVNGKWI